MWRAWRRGTVCDLKAVWQRLGMCVLSLAVSLAMLSQPPPVIAAEPAAGTSLGEALFVHNWARSDEWTRPEPLGRDGDGLGPVFNDVSCVACHSLGGIGGAGGNEHNADMLSVLFPAGATQAQQLSLLKRAKERHAGLTPEGTSVILHGFGFGPGDDMERYDSWRESFVTRDGPDDRRLSIEQPVQEFDGVTFHLSQRSTPALWGAGEIERLRVSVGEELRRRIMLAQRGSSTGVTGRLPGAASGRAGWYGWRGQVDTLREFVMGACANELGLTVAGHPQPENPLRQQTSRSRRTQSLPKNDLSTSQVTALTGYIRSLPRPVRVFPSGPNDLADVYSGERLFESTGCAECHIPQLAFVKEIYTDFLLHDMGQSLSDPVAALPEPTTRTTRRGGGYYGVPPSLRTTTITGPDPETQTRLTQEWRTPPLWAVADTPPYLHDGRADTIDEAIRLHDGEAKRSVEAYQYLVKHERMQLLAFLGTLRAPQTAVTLANGNP